MYLPISAKPTPGKKKSLFFSPFLEVCGGVALPDDATNGNARAFLSSVIETSKVKANLPFKN